MELELKVLTDVDELDQLAAEWEELLSRSRTPEPTQSPLWLVLWWRIFGENRQLRLVTLRDQGHLVGVAPFLRRTHWYHGVPFRRLELLGSGEPEQDEIASEYIGIVVESGRETDVATSLAAALAAGRLGSFDEIVCESMRAECAIVGAMQHHLSERGYRVALHDDGCCRFIPLPGSWEEYLARLSSSRRQRLRRALKDFEKWADGTAALVRAETADDIEAGFEALAELHAERWQEAEQRGVFASSKFSNFHRQVMPKLLERGALDLWTLEVHGEKVAAAYNIVWAGRVHFYQSGRKVDVPKRVRLGIVLHAMAIQSAIERGLVEYDFLAGEARYKQELALAERRLITLRATPRVSMREGARQLLRRSAATVRGARSQLRDRWHRLLT